MTRAAFIFNQIHLSGKGINKSNGFKEDPQLVVLFAILKLISLVLEAITLFFKVCVRCEISVTCLIAFTERFKTVPASIASGS